MSRTMTAAHTSLSSGLRRPVALSINGRLRRTLIMMAVTTTMIAMRCKVL